jgi:MFS family permease
MNKRLFWVFALSSAVYFNQGIESLPAQGLFYYLKETLNFSPQKIMFLGSITISAWLIKPIIGYIIDNFLTKRTWIFLALTLDIILVVLLGLLSLPVFLIIVFLVINSTNAAFRDVSVDGIMCVEGKFYNAIGKIQSVQWISISIAGLITGILGGYLAYRWDYRAGFLGLVPFYLISLIIVYFYKDQPRIKGPYHQRYLWGDLKRLFADRKLIIIAVFIFLYKFSPSFGTPLFFIQRDTFKWGKVWIGALGSIGMVFQIIGALIYYRFSQRINIRKWLYISVFLGALTTLSYLYYKPVTAVIYDIVYSLVGMFIFIMVMDFMARNTIKDLEATSFAFLCSVSNLSLVASNLSGAFLFPLIGLKWLVIISSLTSFLCLFFINKIH